MVEPIDVPFRFQQENGYCLPACAQMALAHLGILRSQDDLARMLGIVEDFGAPASHVLKLRSLQVKVEYHTEGTLAGIDSWLARRIPVIACLQTNQVDYWHGITAQHVVLVVGTDEQAVCLLDPAQDETVITVSTDEFMLAWDDMNFAYAVIFQ